MTRRRFFGYDYRFSWRDFVVSTAPLAKAISPSTTLLRGITRRTQNEIIAGNWQFGDLVLNTSDLSIGNGLSATSTLSGGYGLLGLASTSPYGQFVIEATSLVGSNTPIFAIGDSGTSSPLFYVSGRSTDGAPLIGIGTFTPGAALEGGGSVVVGRI